MTAGVETSAESSNVKRNEIEEAQGAARIAEMTCGVCACMNKLGGVLCRRPLSPGPLHQERHVARWTAKTD